MPVGFEVTTPLPVPDFVMVSVYCGDGVGDTAAKVAVQVLSALRTILAAEEVPAQFPDQPVKVEPVLATAESVIVVLAAYADWQVVPQEIPAGLDVTTPTPVPEAVTDRLNWLGVIGGGVTATKLAVQ